MSTRRSSMVATLLATAAMAADPDRAAAHGEGWLAGSPRGELHASLAAPSVAGLRVQVLDGRVPALFVRNDSRHELVVRDADGSAFLRIGPRGVRADVNSPAYLRSAGAPARTMRPARWRQLSRHPQWAWLEHRARVHDGRAVPDLGNRPRTVHRWTTSIMLGDRQVRLSGRVRWVPAATRAQGRDASEIAFWPAAAAMALGLAIVVAGW